jgi:Spy/CpxP family protein refolding chaperone
MREFRDARTAVVELMSAPTLDRAAAETLRAERIAAIDEASKKMTAAMLDAAEVLTPEQRAELAKHLGERKGPRRW